MRRRNKVCTIVEAGLDADGFPYATYYDNGRRDVPITYAEYVFLSGALEAQQRAFDSSEPGTEEDRGRFPVLFWISPEREDFAKAAQRMREL